MGYTVMHTNSIHELPLHVIVDVLSIMALEHPLGAGNKAGVSEERLPQRRLRVLGAIFRI